MGMIDSLFQRLGYVKLWNYGMTLTPDGRIVPLVAQPPLPPQHQLPPQPAAYQPLTAPHANADDTQPSPPPVPLPRAPIAVGTTPRHKLRPLPKLPHPHSPR